MQVINDCRDLGAHFNAAQGRRAGTTLTGRMWATARSTERLSKHRGPCEKKVNIVRAKKLPMGLYGCEVAPVDEAALRTMRSAIVSCLTFTTVRRSTDFTFATASRGRDVDPDVEIVNRRVVAL